MCSLFHSIFSPLSRINGPYDPHFKIFREQIRINEDQLPVKARLLIESYLILVYFSQIVSINKRIIWRYFYNVLLFSLLPEKNLIVERRSPMKVVNNSNKQGVNVEKGVRHHVKNSHGA